MKALISCPKTVLALNAETGKSKVVCSSRPEYYGISWCPKGMLFSHSNVANHTLVNAEDYANSVKGTLSIDNEETDAFLSVPHQITFYNGKVYCSNTGMNRISVLNLENMSKSEIRFDNHPWDRLGDRKFGKHLNSVCVSDGLLYVCAHNWSSNSKIYVWELSTKSLKELIDLKKPRAAHNVWPFENQIFFCDTRNGALMDARTLKTVWRSPVKSVLTRGLACSKDFILVGLSVPDGSREGRLTSNSKVAIVHRKTMKTHKVLSLGKHGAVHEIRIFDEPDYAHLGEKNVGFVPNFDV